MNEIVQPKMNDSLKQCILHSVTDCFLKQTSQGWDHPVHVVIASDTSVNAVGDLILQWGDNKDGYKRHLPVNSVSEISVKKLNGTFSSSFFTSFKISIKSVY